MGKIYEALEKADKSEGVAVSKLPPPTPKNQFVSKPPRQSQKATGSSGESSNNVLMLESVTKKATIPQPSHYLVAYHQPASLEAELFKQLRTNLLFPTEGKPPKSIMITSAEPGEGKSFVSANLAISIARGIEEHVLLMDCDMRHPTIHSLFGHDGLPGLSNYLTEKAPIPSLLQKTPIEKLTLLPGGPTPINPSELLTSQKMSDLLKEVKTRYEDRYILIDSPPPKLTAESGALARQVDGIILVIKAKKTNRKRVEEVIEIVGKEKILGVVFNWYDTALSRYAGYRHYGYYSPPQKK